MIAPAASSSPYVRARLFSRPLGPFLGPIDADSRADQMKGLDLRLRGLDLLAHLLDHLLVFNTESVSVFDEIGLRALDGGHSGVGLGLR